MTKHTVQESPVSAKPILDPNLVDLSTFLVQPKPPAYVVPGLIPDGVTTLAYGAGGTGKSYWLLALMMHLACRRAYGKFHRPSELQSAYISREESQATLHFRFHSILMEMNATAEQIEMIQRNLSIYNVSGEPGCELQRGSQFLEEVVQSAYGNEMMVFDNLSTMLPKSENGIIHSINSQETAAAIHSACHAVNAEGTAVVLVHHQSTSGRASGSHLLTDNARTVLRFECDWQKGATNRAEDRIYDPAVFNVKIEKNNLGVTDHTGTKWRKNRLNGVPSPFDSGLRPD